MWLSVACVDVTACVAGGRYDGRCPMYESDHVALTQLRQKTTLGVLYIRNGAVSAVHTGWQSLQHGSSYEARQGLSASSPDDEIISSITTRATNQHALGVGKSRSRANRSHKVIVIATIGGIVSFVVGCSCCWLSSRLPTPKPVDISRVEELIAMEEARLSIRWLSFNVTAQVSLLALQLALGFASHSLTLLGDSGHAASDCLMYALATVVEYGKLRVATETASHWIAARIDVWAARLYMFVMACTMVPAIVQAVKQVRICQTPDGCVDEKYAIGSALICFSVVTLLVNIMVMSLRGRWRVGSNLAASTPPRAPLICHPCRTEWKEAFAEPTQDLPASGIGDPSPQDVPDGSLQRFVRVTHGLFHSGCLDPNCQPKSQWDSTPGESQSKTNWNLIAILFHIGVDIGRTLVMMIVGFLSWRDLVNSVLADAVGVLLIGCLCVSGGTLMICGTCVGDTE